MHKQQKCGKLQLTALLRIAVFCSCMPPRILLLVPACLTGDISMHHHVITTD